MKDHEKKIGILILGMGASTFGREKRAVSAFKHMPRLKPYFLISRWEDGSVSRLLSENRFEFSKASFGYLGRAKPLWTLDNIVKWPVLYAKVIFAYIKKKCECVLFLELVSLANSLPAILFLKLLCRARVVFYLGDIPANTRMYRVLGRLVNSIADRIVANSQAVKQGLAAIGIEDQKIQVIYNGKELDRFENAAPRDFRKEYGWPSEAFLAGFVGQFRENKGAEDFLEAAKRVLGENPSCRFLLIGSSGQANGYLQRLLEQTRRENLERHVAFIGWIDEIERAYRGLDVVVVPSRYEDPAPNVVIEAMASCVPVIATKAGGTPELLTNGEGGFLVEKANPQQIAHHILQLLGNRELGEKLGRRGRERASQMFDIRENALFLERALVGKNHVR